jgi:hypothetical protein
MGSQEENASEQVIWYWALLPTPIVTKFTPWG